MAKTTKTGEINREGIINPFDKTAKRPQIPKRKPKLKRAKASKPGPPPFNPSDEDRAVARALAQVGLSQEDLGRHFGVCVEVIVKHFKNEMQVADGTVLAHGYGAVAKALRAKHEGIGLSAGKFILGTKGRKYGWGSGHDRPPVPDDFLAGADPTLLNTKQWDTLVELYAIMGVDLLAPYGVSEPKLIGSSAKAS